MTLHSEIWLRYSHRPELGLEVVVTKSNVDSLPQTLLEGRPAGSLLLTPQQLQQLQRLQAAQEQAGGALTLTLQQGGGGGVAPQLVLAPQGFISGSAQPSATHEHILHTSQQIGHTSIQHVLQSSISHVRQASILQSSIHPIPVSHQSQVSSGDVHKSVVGGGGEGKVSGGGASPVSGPPTSPFSPHTVTPSPSPTHQHVVHTPQHSVLQLFHQQARNTVQSAGAALAQGAMKTKQPPQILPKPPGNSVLGTGLTNTVSKPTHSSNTPVNAIPQHQGTLLLNQMLPNGAVLVQQQTSSGVQLILKSPPPTPQPKPGLVIANGGLQPQAVIVQGRTQAHQVLRLVPGQMQLQQIQTSSGPTLIAVPSQVPAPPRATPPPQQISAALAQKKFKKKKKKEEEPRLDLANLIKISGIDEEDVSPVSQGSQINSQNLQTHQVLNKSTSTNINSPSTPKQHHSKPSQLLAQLQTPSQVGAGLRLSVGEDGTMVVHQAEQQTTMTPSITAAAQSQLAQLIADHGGQILQANSGLTNNASKEAAFMQSLQTAVLQLTGSGDGMVLKSNINSTPVVLNTGVRRGSTSGMVVAPSLPQNGVRLVADLNGLQQSAPAVSLTEHNRLIVSGIANVAPAMLEQNRLQIVAGVPTSAALSLEQQNRIIVSGMTTPSTMLSQQQNRVIVSNVAPEQNRVLVTGVASSLEEQNRVQIVSSNSSAMSLTEQNRVIVSNVPSDVSLEQQNKLHLLSSVPNSNVSLTDQNRVQIVSGMPTSLTEQQNRVIVSGVQNSNMSLEQQNRVQIVSGSQTTGSMSLEQQNKVQIVSNVQSSVTEQQNRLQIVSGVPNANTLSLSEQNRLQIVSNVPNANALSLTEKQNLVHIVNSNISLSEQQNRLQIITSMPSTVSLTDQSRLRIINSEANTNALSLSDQNRVQVVTSMPASNPLAEHNRIQIVTSVPNSMTDHGRLITSMHNAVAISEHNHARIVTSVPSMSLTEQSRNQSVQSVPVSSTFSENHNKVHIVTSVGNSSTFSDQRLKVVTSNLREEPNNVHVVSALLSSEKVNPNDTLLRHRESTSAVRFQQYIRPSDLRLIAQGVNKEKEFNKTEEREEKKHTTSDSLSTSTDSPRLQFITNSNDDSRVQIVGANSHTTVISQTHMRSQVYPQATSPKTSIKSPGNFPPHSPVSSPPSTPFNNRPHLTVVTQPQRFQGDQVAVVNNVQTSVGTQINNIKSDQPTTKPLQTNRRTYDNAFLDSIAQSHPSLVINKSPNTSTCAKLLKSKKPMKKAALVKPMMVEDRTSEKEEPPSLVPINISSDHVVSRVQTIQLTPQKQQQLKQIQAQVAALNSNKCRTPQEQATLQRLISEQHKILLGGKLVPTVPGQHAQGLAFVSSGTSGSPVRLLQSGPRVPNPPSATVESQPQPPIQTTTTTHANKATSPIHIQQVSTQTSVQVTPSQPIFTRARRAALIEQQMQADRQGALAPDTRTPFLSKSDTVKRLIRYHTMNEPVLSEKDLAKADELFEQTAKHLLDKKTHMYNKFTFLILKESMRLQQTSELVLLERLFTADETARLEQLKQEASAPPPPPPPPQPPPSQQQASTVVKREREDCDSNENKKHCPDDEEINAQVQSAIDSILNLQRNDPLEEAVRSITSS